AQGGEPRTEVQGTRAWLDTRVLGDVNVAQPGPCPAQGLCGAQLLDLHVKEVRGAADGGVTDRGAQPGRVGQRVEVVRLVAVDRLQQQHDTPTGRLVAQGGQLLQQQRVLLRLIAQALGVVLDENGG